MASRHDPIIRPVNIDEVQSITTNAVSHGIDLHESGKLTAEFCIYAEVVLNGTIYHCQRIVNCKLLAGPSTEMKEMKE